MEGRVLIRITNRCYSGCPHCMIDASGPTGEHMSMETFEEAMGFVHRTGTRVLLVSGGEPFEHPQVFEMVERLKAFAMENIIMVAFISNGHFIFDEEKLAKVRQTDIGVQVTCDPRYYPRLLLREWFLDEQFTFEDRLRLIFPCRRTREAGIVATKSAPNCFNLRSATRSHGFMDGSALLTMQGRVCAPSINVDGTVRAGEADTCHQIGTVRSTVEEINDAILMMRCGKCGLGADLGERYLEAIGGAV